MSFSKKVVIGAGQCGTRLASKYALGGDRLIAFNYFCQNRSFGFKT